MLTRILVIDDNPDNLKLMTYLLNCFGYLTAAANDGQEGLAAIINETPDLILCDIQLPNVSGYEIAKTIKSNTELNIIPLIAVTAYSMASDRDRILAAGFDGYITKPIDPEHFVKQIEVFLPEKQRAKQK